MNYFIDAIAQPMVTAAIEVLLWISIFKTADTVLIGGFDREAYLSYALWGAFIARITVSWMYEFRMIEEIETGTINSLLVRPMSFFEFYLSQLMGYKLVTTVISLFAPIAATLIFGLPLHWERLPQTFALILYYLILVHTVGFCLAMFAFHLNRVSSLVIAKNLALWILSGELLPLDLMPEPYRGIILALPFSNAVYIPVGYLTGRFGTEMFMQGFATTTAGLMVFGCLAYWGWTSGTKTYAGTGA